jgi:hypothetical protein
VSETLGISAEFYILMHDKISREAMGCAELYSEYKKANRERKAVMIEVSVR